MSKAERQAIWQAAHLKTMEALCYIAESAE
jgi:hypothetical protein